MTGPWLYIAGLARERPSPVLMAAIDDAGTKAELATFLRGISLVTLKGRRGWSAIAGTAVNALAFGPSA